MEPATGLPGHISWYESIDASALIERTNEGAGMAGNIA